MAVQLERYNGKVKVTDRGRDAGTFKSVEIHGCDTTVPGRGTTRVYGVESTWEEAGTLHLSGDKRAGSQSSGGLGGLGGLG